MARKRTNTLSDGLLADVREATRRVLGEGVANGGNAIAQAGASDYWLRIDGVESAAVPGGAARVYQCSIFRSPTHYTTAIAANVLAISVADLANSSTPTLANGTWHRTQGRYLTYETPDKLYYVFSPSVELPIGGSKYQVLMRVDDNGTLAWSFPRFA